jgi:hypothetical protein
MRGRASHPDLAPRPCIYDRPDGARDYVIDTSATIAAALQPVLEWRDLVGGQ